MTRTTTRLAIVAVLGCAGHFMWSVLRHDVAAVSARSLVARHVADAAEFRCTGAPYRIGDFDGSGEAN